VEETGGFPERGAAIGRDWTKGNVFRNLLMLSWPMFIGNVVMILGFTVDLFWVGKLGPVAIAGVGIGGIAIMLVITMPLAYLLPQITDAGVYGIRWAMVAGMVAGAVAFLIYFRTGRWKRKRV